MKETTFPLRQEDIPRCFYNIAADMPNPLAPPLNPATKQPIGPEALAAIFPMALIEQEVSTQAEIPIPDEVRQIYGLYRPTPLVRATRLEEALKTPAHIYYKYEGVSPCGSHKPNTAIAQAYYNAKAGIKKLTTETGAGQWGSALALAGAFFGLEIEVYMVRISFEQKPYRKSMMQTYGAQVFPSPTDRTAIGRKIRAERPDTPGSLGIAISEAIEIAANDPHTNYSLGSVLNHVLLHQTIIGQEAKKQMALAGDYPDVVIACHGGGSNFGGIAFPFLRDKIAGKKVRFVAAEPESCPSLTKGEFRYDFGDVAGMTPLMQMYTLGSDFIPAPIHAGGLRYHGASPLVSQLLHDGLIEAASFAQKDIFEAALLFARTQGIIPAPESSHAIRAAIDEAIKAREAGRETTILFNLSGHGDFDMTAYDAYLSGKIA